MIVGSVYFPGRISWLSEEQLKEVRTPAEVKGCDLLVLHGGEDISPSIYGQKPVHTSAQPVPSKRDQAELDVVMEAVRLGVPILGCCRGAQLLCAVSGGTLFQHVNNHSGCNHSIDTHDGRVIYTNSMHHQMMRLADHDIILATAPHVARSRWTDNGEYVGPEPEVEVAYFPELNAIGVQGHPEWLGEHTPLVRYTQDILKEYLL